MSADYGPGAVVLENWKITRKIGDGNFGTVYEIHRTDFGVDDYAALKVISVPQSSAELQSALAEGMTMEEAKSYFFGIVQEIVQEFAIMASLKGGKNIVYYEDHQVVPHDGGIGWDVLIRMELLQPLPAYQKTHGLDRQQVLQLGLDICNALELCEQRKVIHRDVKPENILVSANGTFKLGDFGIARTIEKTTSGLSKKGTFTYMAPEVYHGQEYGFGVDLYSLGLILYKLMNEDRMPFMPVPPEPIRFQDRERAQVRRLKGEALPLPCGAQDSLGRVICKACDFRPENRYRTAAELRRALQDCQSGAGAASWQQSTEPRFRKVQTTGSFRENNATVGMMHENNATIGMMHENNATIGMMHGETLQPEKKKQFRGWIPLIAGACALVAILTVLLIHLQHRKEEAFAPLEEIVEENWTRETVLSWLIEQGKQSPRERQSGDDDGELSMEFPTAWNSGNLRQEITFDRHILQYRLCIRDAGSGDQDDCIFRLQVIGSNVDDRMEKDGLIGRALLKNSAWYNLKVEFLNQQQASEKDQKAFEQYLLAELFPTLCVIREELLLDVVEINTDTLSNGFVRTFSNNHAYPVDRIESESSSENQHITVSMEVPGIWLEPTEFESRLDYTGGTIHLKVYDVRMDRAFFEVILMEQDYGEYPENTEQYSMSGPEKLDDGRYWYTYVEANASGYDEETQILADNLEMFFCETILPTLRWSGEYVFSEENYNDTYDSNNSGSYIFPHSDTSYLTEQELRTVTHEELCFARNEIYARHGWIFHTPALKNYFERQDWYYGTDTVETFPFEELNEIEKYNIALIKDCENAWYGGSYY